MVCEIITRGEEKCLLVSRGRERRRDRWRLEGMVADLVIGERQFSLISSNGSSEGGRRLDMRVSENCS